MQAVQLAAPAPVVVVGATHVVQDTAPNEELWAPSSQSEQLDAPVADA